MKEEVKAFLSWFEDNMGEETWLRSEYQEDDPDGTWVSYLELPEYKDLAQALENECRNDQ